MMIVVDENVPRRTVTALETLGHTVLDIRGTSSQGAPDPSLWQMAQDKQALLISTDKEFGDHWREVHFGILIVRLRQPNRLKIHERVVQAMRDIPEREWPGLLVVMRDQVRNTRRAPDTHSDR